MRAWTLFLFAILTLGCGDDVDPADAGRDITLDVPTQEVDATSLDAPVDVSALPQNLWVI